jgi:hypothetical protein
MKELLKLKSILKLKRNLSNKTINFDFDVLVVGGGHAGKILFLISNYNSNSNFNSNFF